MAGSSWQHAHTCITSHAAVFGETSNHLDILAPLQLRFGTLRLLAFPETKITFEREEISDCWWDSGKYDKAADGNWENCVRSQGAYFEGDWGITVLCTIFLVSSSINIFIYHSTWLDTFWTDLIRSVCLLFLSPSETPWEQGICLAHCCAWYSAWSQYTLDIYLMIEQINSPHQFIVHL